MYIYVYIHLGHEIVRRRHSVFFLILKIGFSMSEALKLTKKQHHRCNTTYHTMCQIHPYIFGTTMVCMFIIPRLAKKNADGSFGVSTLTPDPYT